MISLKKIAEIKNLTEVEIPNKEKELKEIMKQIEENINKKQTETESKENDKEKNDVNVKEYTEVPVNDTGMVLKLSRSKKGNR